MQNAIYASLFVPALLISLPASIALAQSEKKDEQNPKTETPYQPKTGEQPVFGKKYYPTQTSSDLFLEVNPLLLVNRGLGVEFEKRGGQQWSFGLDMQYLNAELYRSGETRARVEYLAVAPKVRIYPMETMSGFFFGGKLLIGQITSEVTKGATSQKSNLVLTPAVHAGFRIATFSGFTFAAYLGGGINFPRPEFKRDDLKAENRSDAESNEAREKINASNGLFRPDFGLTLGIAL